MYKARFRFDKYSIYLFYLYMSEYNKNWRRLKFQILSICGWIAGWKGRSQELSHGISLI